MAEDISHILAGCAREAQVFAGGSLAGAVDYAKDHPVNAVVDAGFGIAIGLATKNYTGLAHMLTVGAAGMILSSELSKLAKGDLPKIFAQTWNDESGKHIEANAHRVGDILGPMTFNTVAVSAFGGAAMAYGKYAGRFSIADTDAVRIGNPNWASNYYGKRIDRMPGMGFTRVQEDGLRAPMLTTSVRELEQVRDRLPFEPESNVYLERLQQPVADSKGLSSYTGKFEHASIGQFKRIAESHPSMMDEKFQPNPVRTEIAE
jgi:hypothetical protein